MAFRLLAVAPECAAALLVVPLLAPGSDMFAAGCFLP